MKKKRNERKAWIVSADMGYGHQRAAYPLKDLANERIINANSDKIISENEKKTWKKARIFYEWVSRMNEIPVIGSTIFRIFNTIQNIKPYYPLGESSKPSMAVNFLHKKVSKGFCKSLIKYVSQKNIPFVTTFFIPAIAANYHKLPHAYAVVTDTDINRIWVPKNPSQCRIKYFVPCEHAYNRMTSYGVKEENLYLTGFPLPKENIGGITSPITKKFLARRLINLDPTKRFLEAHKPAIKAMLGNHFNMKLKPKPLTITFVVGGAGAQSQIGVDMLMSFKQKIIDGKVNICLVAGTHLDLKQDFIEAVERLGLKKRLGKNITIISEITKKEYFAKFNEQLNKTDILWTKPSELSFYCALGIPIIIAPPLGAQEVWNRKWLFAIGAGSDQEKPLYSAQWIIEKLHDGRLARKAWNGFLNAPRLGTYNIERIIFKNKE